MSVRSTRREVGVLALPVEKLRTLTGTSAEIRIYYDEYIDRLVVGKRVDTLGTSLAVRLGEPRLQARLSHPNLVPVISATEVLGPPGVPPELLPLIEIVTPYYERGSLFDALHRGDRFAVTDVLAIGRRAGLGLAELHRHGVVHRDVKPGNLLLPDDGTIVKVGDLGAAAELRDGVAPGLDSPVPWAAPEQRARAEATPASDLYGLALTLIEALLGPFPYDDYDVADWAKRLGSGHPALYPRHLCYPPTCPPRLRKVLRRASRPHPAERHASVLEFVDELARVEHVDWRLVTDSDGQCRWEGSHARSPGASYAVEAVFRPRRSLWQVSGYRRRNAWMRCYGPDEADPTRLHFALAAAFDGVLCVAQSDAR